MKELIGSVTGKGQVTIPVEVRKLLGVHPHDKVAFIVYEDQVQLQRRGSVVSRTAGMLKSAGTPLSAAGLREAGEEAIAHEAVERGR